MLNNKRLNIFLIIIFISAALPAFAAKDPDIRDYGRISVTGNYQRTFGDLKNDLPAGGGFVFAYDQGLDKITGKRQIWLPGFRFELGFTDYKNKNNEIGGLGMNAGPVWTINILQNSFVTFSVLPGVSMLAVKNDSADTVSNVFSTHGILMYEHSIENIFLFAGIRCTYLDNESSPLTGAGLTAGLGYRI